MGRFRLVRYKQYLRNVHCYYTVNKIFIVNWLAASASLCYVFEGTIMHQLFVLKVLPVGGRSSILAAFTYLVTVIISLVIRFKWVPVRFLKYATDTRLA